MAGVSFGIEPAGIWTVSGWMFRQALRDLRTDASLSDQAVRALTDAERVGFLAVELLSASIGRELTEGLDRMCRRILEDFSSHRLPDDLSDPDTRRMYEEGLQTLAMSIRAATAPHELRTEDIEHEGP